MGGPQVTCTPFFQKLREDIWTGILAFALKILSILLLQANIMVILKLIILATNFLQFMLYKSEILWTTIALVIFIILAQLIRRIVRKFALIRSLDPNRKKIILNIFYGIGYLFFMIALAIIWGVDVKQFTLFISSVLAVLGVGFFAQWSILSNLTASVILFFYHPLRIGDRIRVIDKDYDWVGEIKDITGFFLFMKTDTGEEITLPNSLVLQHGIEMLERKEVKNSG